MSELNTYRIPFNGLKNGIHVYEFDADESFFSKFEESLVRKAKVQFEVSLEKLTTLMNLDVAVSGSLESDCDRCGGELVTELSGDFKVIVKFGDETSDLIDDIIVLGPSEHFLDLDQLFYEFAFLCMPQRLVHEDEKDCNQKALEALRRFELKEKEEYIDPRWSQLKNLK